MAEQRYQTSVDDFVVAKASKNPTDQQISIQADDPDFTAEAPKYLSGFFVGRLAWAQRIGFARLNATA
jgi:hypothetical protein